MIEFDEYTFASKYNLSPSDFEDVDLTTLPFSVRVINCFLSNKIHTMAELLQLTPLKMLSFRNFGRTSLREIEEYLEKVSGGSIAPQHDLPVNITVKLARHAEEIAVGDFSFAEKLPLSAAEQSTVDAYREAYECLGDELALDCVCSPEHISPIAQMFTGFVYNTSLIIEIDQLIQAIPYERRTKKASGFITAFTSKEDERNSLFAQYDDGARIDEIKRDNLNALDPQSYKTIRKFLKWCQYDLAAEINELFSIIYNNERVREVVRGRAAKKTLDEIGSEFGITRERVRQIESKAKRRFEKHFPRIKFLPKVSAELNGEAVITPSTLSRFCPQYAQELLFLTKSYQSASFTYDSQLDLFILGDDSLKNRVNTIVENLPDILNASKAEEIIAEASEFDDIPEEMMRRALLDAYRVTGEVYHRTRLSLAVIYENILKKHYPDGILAYDSNQIKTFREYVKEEYGDVGLPENDRALTARIAGICVLCGRGMYTVKKKKYIPDELKDKIYRYIKESKNTIFLTNTLFSVFEDDLADAGITNKYYLQGVLHELFGDEFYFRRDYVSKDPYMTSMYAAIEEFIYNSDYPVNKQQIKQEFPGVSEIVIMLSVSGPNILNYFGQYLHSEKLRLGSTEVNKIRNHLRQFLSDGTAHTAGEVYDELSPAFHDTFSRNGVFFPFSAFSLLEFLFRKDFQFSRPYVALPGVEIGRPTERLHEYVYNSDEIAVSDLFDYVRENKIYVQSMLGFINSCNDQFIFADEDNVIRIELSGVNKEIAEQVEELVLAETMSTVPIRDLMIWNKLPTISVPWSEWLVYSVLYKWGRRTEVSTSSGQLRYAVPLVAPLGKMDASDYKDMKKDHSATYQCDNLDDIDSLLADMISDDMDLLDDVTVEEI